MTNTNTAQGQEQSPGENIAARIKHILSVFPKLSHSMLQVGLGSTIPAKDWRPILDEMVAEGTVSIQTKYLTTPAERSQGYSIISLTEEE